MDIVDKTGLGPIPYAEGDTLQHAIHAEVAEGKRPDTVIFAEFEPTFTAGSRTKPEDVPDGSVPVVPIDRGGSVTWHGPGQLVCYPIIRLREPIDVIRYVLALEYAVMHLASHEFALQTCLVKGRSGVWIRREGDIDRKLCALGVKTSKNTTLHGIALNICPDISDFHRVIPCGLSHADVATLSMYGCSLRGVPAADLRPADLVAPLMDALEFYLQTSRAAVESPQPWPDNMPTPLPAPTDL